MTRTLSILIGLAIVSAGAGPARAGCLGTGWSNTPARAGCTIADNAMPNPTSLAPLADVSGNGELLAVVSPWPMDRPPTNTVARYVCTPSGFGQTASCSLR